MRPIKFFFILEGGIIEAKLTAA